MEKVSVPFRGYVVVILWRRRVLASVITVSVPFRGYVVVIHLFVTDGATVNYGFRPLSGLCSSNST